MVVVTKMGNGGEDHIWEVRYELVFMYSELKIPTGHPNGDILKQLDIPYLK
jgi:hypothetical protein